MTEPASSGLPVEIRPIAPARRLTPADGWVLRGWLLRADPGDGTLVFTRERTLLGPRRRRVLALPSAGRPDAVSAVCLASYRWTARGRFAARPEGVSSRLLLLRRDGHAIAAGRVHDEDTARQMWPPELFAPLRDTGIHVTEERFASARELERAHPGASPRWWWGTRPGLALIGTGLTVLIVLIVGVAVYAATH